LRIRPARWGRAFIHGSQGKGGIWLTLILATQVELEISRCVEGRASGPNRLLKGNVRSPRMKGEIAQSSDPEKKRREEEKEKINLKRKESACEGKTAEISSAGV